MVARLKLKEIDGRAPHYRRSVMPLDVLGRTRATLMHATSSQVVRVKRYWNWNSGNNRVRCSPDWSVYRCIERYCMTPRQREDDNNLSVGHRNHLKLGIEPESWLQSHELGF